MTFTFQTAAGVNGDLPSSNGFVDVFFPVGFLYNKASTIICTVRDFTVATATTTTCTTTYATDDLGQYLVKVEADLKCGTLYTCSGGKKYVFTIDGLVNPFNT